MKQFDFEKMPIVEIANEIIMDAVRKNASDIHLDPTKDGVRIRIRIDGILSDYSFVDAKYRRNLVSRIKMIAGMNIMETRLPPTWFIRRHYMCSTANSCRSRRSSASSITVVC